VVICQIVYESKLQVLTSILGSCRIIGREHLFYCPSCKHHKRKLSVNIDKNRYKCWTCNLRGSSIFYLIKRYGTAEHINQWLFFTGETNLAERNDLRLLLDPREEEKEEVLFQLPEEFVSLVGSKSLYTKQVRSYLYDRGISNKDIINWKIGFCENGEYAGRVIVPSFNLYGKINYFVARSYNGIKPKYRNPPLSNNTVVFNHLFVNFKKPIVLVEGVFDAIKSGTNSVPLLGSILSENSKLFHEIIKNNTTCYMALDPDARNKENKAIKTLLTYGINLYKIVVSPYNDVGEMTKTEFLQRKKEAIPINNETFVLYQLMNG